MTELASALYALERTDRALRSSARDFHTLDPERARPSALREIAERLISPASEPDRATVFCTALARIARGQLEHFPENLFWDFDYIAASLWRAGQGAGGVGRIARLERMFLGLHSRFGCRSPIRFRYVHDFVYGLDWERWAARDPEKHAAVGPFDRAFLVRVLGRGREITACIARGDDAAFPPLPDGAWRNPFAFSRAPEHELPLHRELARRGEIPVPCWRLDAVPDFGKPYTQMRVQLARKLGIPGDYG